MPMHDRRSTGWRIARACALVVVAGCALDAQGAGDALHAPTLEQSLAPAVQLRDSVPRRFSLRERLAHHRVPGVSVAVMQAGRVTLAQGWGVADVTTGRRVDSTTLFQAASISKPLAALTALSLVERGDLHLDAPINEVLTSWRVPAAEQQRDTLVTLRRLLAHTAGTSVSGFPGYRTASRDDAVTLPSNVDVLEGRGNTAAVRVVRDPGSGFSYSGGGYTIVEQAIEDRTGRPFADVVAERVLGPSGMTRSTFAQPLPRARWSEAAHAHDATGAPVPGAWHDYPEQAAAGLWTTPADLLRLGAHLAAVWRGEETDGVGPPATLREMFVHRGEEPGFESYGLGFGITGAQGTLSFGHNGGNEGFLSIWVVYPARGEGVAVMTNGARGFALAQEIVRGVAAQLGWPAFGSEVRAARALDASVLAAYAGTYARDDGGLTVTLAVDAGGLRVRSADQGTSRLVARADATDAFFDPDDGQAITFERDAAGRVVALVAGGRIRLVRR